MELNLAKREKPKDPGDFPSDPAPAVRLQKELLEEALRSGASDIHIEPRVGAVQVRYRIDGGLTGGPILPKQVQENLVSRFKISCNLNISEKRHPQDGSFRFAVAGQTLDLRVSCLPSLWGEKVVIRILARESGVRRLDQLGLSATPLQTLAAMAERPQGMILVVGPTGSGKSTTLYALLQAIHRPRLNLLTLEDPVEYLQEDLTQIQVNEKIGLTFASALRSILRQDPDVIMVGEIRDEETALIAFRAAMTGHLVLSTLHTNDAVATVTRLFNLGLAPYLMASSLLGILSQRLVRRNCPRCLEPYRPEPELLHRYPFLVPLLGSAPQEFLRRSRGCPECRGTGVSGREGVFELLTVSPAFREAILQRASETELRSLALAEGMKTLLDCAFHKTRAGKISMEELLRVVPYDVGARGCPRCHHPLEPTFRYCPRCAFLLLRQCGTCRQELQKSWRVCPRCGSPCPAAEEGLVPPAGGTEVGGQGNGFA
ncbi:MAG: Flp pilus assembly complex ATPase component TadA [Deltaproteobacteria bacterium]|nr:Flp pilus assembly complex ATPase component TadA [Deltaproteobacteria bacterium]